MTKQQGMGVLLGICALMVVLSLAGFASDFITHLLGNIDGLLLFAISLMILAIFAIMLLQLAKEEGWLGGKERAPATTAAAKAPAPSAPSETVPAAAKEGK